MSRPVFADFLKHCSAFRRSDCARRQAPPQKVFLKLSVSAKAVKCSTIKKISKLFSYKNFERLAIPYNPVYCLFCHNTTAVAVRIEIFQHPHADTCA